MALDLAEELRRSQIADALSLLGLNDSPPPSTDDSGAKDTSEQLDEPKRVAEHLDNPNNWPTVYDTTTQQAVGAPSPEPDIQPKFDTESKQYVGVDQKPEPEKKLEPITAEAVVPYGERETPAAKSEYAPMDTGKGVVPGTYPTVAEDQGAELPADALPQVERATLVKLPDEGLGERGAPIKPDLSQTTGFAVADPNPINHDYRTPLSSDDELKFRAWVKKNKVPFDDSPTSDYDMRGFWKAQQEGDPDVVTSVSKFDNRIHYVDKFKTPFHRTFSRESQYATQDAPQWIGDQLIDKNGNLVADETPGSKQKPVHVERGQLVKGPSGPITTRVEPITPQEPTVSPPNVQRAQPVVPATQLPNAPLTQAQPTQLPNAPLTPAPRVKLSSELTQGPPGTKPAGTQDEPYWPKTADQIKQMPPGSVYVDPTDGSIKTTPGTAPAVPASPSTPAAQPAQGAVKVNPRDPSTWSNADGSPVAAPPQAAVSREEPMLAPNGKPPTALIIHHTSGNNSAASVVEDWRTNRPGVGSQMILDRDGTVHYTQKEFGYGGTGHFLHSVIPGVSNQTAVGIEVIAKDDADMTSAQLETLKRLAGPDGPYANTAVYGHSQVSPGDRDNEGVRGVSAIMEARKAGGQPSSQPDLTVTHYAYQGDPDLDPESAKGHGKYVKDMVAGYDVALNAAGAAAVGNPKPGSEFEYGGRTWRYADQIPERYKDARIDIYDPNNHFGDFKPGGTASAQAPAVKKSAVDDWPDVAPATVATAQAQTSKEFDTLNTIRDRTPNVGAFWKILNSPIAGVSDNARNQYQAQAKKNITDYALDYYKGSNPNITPDEAFKLATGDANFGTLAGEVMTKIIPNYQHAIIALSRNQEPIDENRINDFLSTINPNLPPEKRVEFKRKTMAELASLNPTERAQHIGALIAQDPQLLAGFNAVDLADSFDRISDPAYQARRKMEEEKMVAKNMHDLQVDPRLANTPAEAVTQVLAGMPKNVTEMLTGPIGHSMMLAEIRTDTTDQLRKENPNMSEDELRQKASGSTIAQVAAQEIIMRLGGSALNSATKGITQPLLELGARLGMHGSVASVMAGVTRMIANQMEGRDLMNGVPEAASSAFPLGMVGGAMAGRHVPEPKPEPTVMEPNLNTGKVHGPPEPTADTGFVHGPSGELMAVPEDTGAVHGPLLEETGVSHGPPEPRDTRRVFGPPQPRTAFTPSELAEQVGAMKGKTPEDLAAEVQGIYPVTDMTARDVGDRGPSTQVQEAQAQARVEQQTLGQRVARLSTVQRSVFNDLRRNGMTPEEALPRVERSTKTSYPDVRAEALAPLRQVQPQRVEDQPKQEAQAPPVTAPGSGGVPVGTSPPPIHIGESEPYTSKIANRYTAERMATGELGQVDPSQGKSTEELVMQGFKMTPAQREGLIDNFVKGKGGDLDQHGAAIRSKEAMLSIQSHEAARAAEADPTNLQLKANAEAASKAVTDFYNGPIKKLKRVWSDAGRGMMKDVPVDYTTVNGMMEAYAKGAGNGKEAPPEMVPKLKQVAAKVKKSANDEEAAMDNLGKEIEKQARGKIVPDDNSVRARLMEIMKNLPCRK